jgi:endonuclease YncB( thermonuclease family)
VSAPKVKGALNHVYSAVVVKVKDGDTISASVRLLSLRRFRDRDLGFHLYIEGGWLVLHEDFRFFGINANEHGTPEGDKATAFLRGLIAPGDLVVIATKVVSDKDAKEKYGRWLGTLWRPKDDTSVNDQMVAAGHARPWDGKGARPTT